MNVSYSTLVTLRPLLNGQLHWEIDCRKVIGIYRNFDGKLLHSYFMTVSEVFFGANSSKSDDFVAS